MVPDFFYSQSLLVISSTMWFFALLQEVWVPLSKKEPVRLYRSNIVALIKLNLESIVSWLRTKKVHRCKIHFTYPGYAGKLAGEFHPKTLFEKHMRNNIATCCHNIQTPLLGPFSGIRNQLLVKTRAAISLQQEANIQTIQQTQTLRYKGS